MERLARQLLLEPHALGDVTRVEHDAAYAPVVAEIGDVRFDMPPFPELVRQPEDELVRLRVDGRGAHRALIVGMHEAEQGGAEQRLFSPAQHLHDGVTHVAAPA